MDEVDDDRQPESLSHPPDEREMTEVDGNRADVDGNRAEPPLPGAPARGRRRRRRRWRGGPRQPASGSPPA
jgi:hypothetical protein